MEPAALPGPDDLAQVSRNARDYLDTMRKHQPEHRFRDSTTYETVDAQRFKPKCTLWEIRLADLLNRLRHDTPEANLHYPDFRDRVKDGGDPIVPAGKRRPAVERMVNVHR